MIPQTESGFPAQASLDPVPIAPAPIANDAHWWDPVIKWVVEHTSTDWLLRYVIDYGPNLLKAVLIFIVGRWLARLATSLVIRAARRTRIDRTLIGFLDNLLYMLLLTAVCISALGKLGVDTTSLTAVLAAAGFAIGMALQGSLGNLAAGVMLVFFKPFRVGDVVKVSGKLGTVVEIQLFNTILLTLDNVRIYVPNSQITNDTIENLSSEKERRIDLVIGCGYNDDLKQVKAALIEIVQQHPDILQYPEPVVAVLQLNDSSVDFAVRPWVPTELYWDVRFDLIEKIKLVFDERGFTIPFPSRDLFVHQAASSSQPSLLKAA